MSFQIIVIFAPDVYDLFGSAARHPGYHFHRHLFVKPWHKVTVRLYITQTRLLLSNDILLNATPSAVPLSVLIRVLNNLSAEQNHSEKTPKKKKKLLPNDELCIKGQRHQ